jgi:riboflavin kinase / FMN adenylyltransferase
MILIRKLVSDNSLMQNNLSNGSVVTIGNFDGLHLGHQAIFAQLKKSAMTLKLPAIVISFEPLPREYFSKHQSDNLPRLTRFKERYHFLKNLGIDIFICLHFNEKLAQLKSTDFIQKILLNALNINHLIVGQDFRFGSGREGDLALLKAQGTMHGFSVEVASVLEHEMRRISSTWIREALKKDELLLAEKLLGRPYSLSGKVVHGDKRAREWGVPTANLNVHRSIIQTVLPIKGVYVVSVSIRGRGEQNIFGVANVGRRPTVNGFRNLLEVHLFNFNESIYGQTLEVKFIHKLRDEKRFDSLDLLKVQILADVSMAKELCS